MARLARSRARRARADPEAAPGMSRAYASPPAAPTLVAVAGDAPAAPRSSRARPWRRSTRCGEVPTTSSCAMRPGWRSGWCWVWARNGAAAPRAPAARRRPRAGRARAADGVDNRIAGLDGERGAHVRRGGTRAAPPRTGRSGALYGRAAHMARGARRLGHRCGGGLRAGARLAAGQRRLPRRRVAGAFATRRLSYPFGYWNGVGAWGAMSVALTLAASVHARA